MKRFRKFFVGGLLIAGTVFLAGSDSNCEFENDDGFDFDDDDGFDFKPILGAEGHSESLLAAKLYPLFPNA